MKKLAYLLVLVFIVALMSCDKNEEFTSKENNVQSVSSDELDNSVAPNKEDFENGDEFDNRL